MKSEFALAFNQICAEYNLPREVVLDAVSAALVTAYRRDWKVSATQNVAAEISLETGLARIFVEREVVEEVEDPELQIAVRDARRRKPNVQVGDLMMVDVTPKDFGRIAAQTAKQVITQRLREAERESQFNRFSRQENEIIIGTIHSVTPQGVTLYLERTEEAHMPKREQIPGERYTLHQKIRVYVLEVRRSPRGPEIIVSRSHPLMLRRLLELEVPEIRNGQVEIAAVAREAGTRAKVAVFARQPGLDAVGACVGMRGMRIQTISRELQGERIDVIEWSKDPEVFITNALSLPSVVCVNLDEHNPGGRTASVVVMDDQLSLAIGRAGQNARLAAKLTNWRIDIQGVTEASLWALEQVNKVPELADMLKGSAGLIPRLASIVRIHEQERLPYTDEERNVISSAIKAVRQALIALRESEQPGAHQARARRSAQERADAARVQARKDASARVPAQAYEIPISDLDLSEKVFTHLATNGIQNVGQVMERIALGDEALLMLTGVGVKALKEIKDAVAASQLDFVDPDAPIDVPVAEVEQAETLVAEADAVTVDEGSEVEAPEPSLVDSEVAESEAVDVEAGIVVTESGAILALDEEPEPAVAEVAESDLEPATVAFHPEALAAEFEEDEETESDEGSDRKGDRKKRKKGRQIVYDDSTGEMFVVRRRRRGGGWDDLEGNF